MPATARKKGATRYARSRRKGDVTYSPTENDRKIVQSMVAVGFNQSTVCERLGITDKTLRKHFRRDLDIAYNTLVHDMRVLLVNAAKAGNMQCLIHLNKILGWTDRPLPAANGNASLLPLQNMDEAALWLELMEFLTTEGRLATV